MFGFNFAPTGWAVCNGQILPISQNTALFSLLGVSYGGDGKSTFALPNMQGNAPMHQGQGPGLSQHFLGEQGGTPTVQLLQSEMPLHNHVYQGSGSPEPAVANPAGQLAGKGLWDSGSESGQVAFYTPAAGNPPLSPMASQAIGVAGSDQPHNNMQPFLAVNFCIALQGIYPPRD
jgi:microcystin-dependent protein